MVFLGDTVSYCVLVLTYIGLFLKSAVYPDLSIRFPVFVFQDFPKAVVWLAIECSGVNVAESICMHVFHLSCGFVY